MPIDQAIYAMDGTGVGDGSVGALCVGCWGEGVEIEESDVK